MAKETGVDITTIRVKSISLHISSHGRQLTTGEDDEKDDCRNSFRSLKESSYGGFVSFECGAQKRLYHRFDKRCEVASQVIGRCDFDSQNRTQFMRIYASTVAAIFLLSAVWYFFPAGRECVAPLLFAMRLALPAAVLTLGGIGILPRLMTFGFCFCTIGDAMGVIGSFEGQMGGFALAQICFITQFIREIRLSAKDVSQRKPQQAVLVAATLVCLPPLILAALKVIPAIQELPIRIGCIVYALLLLMAVWTSIVRAFSVKKYSAMAGCLFFLISDFTLSWNKFTEHVPHASLCIMSTYYAALLLIFCGTIRTNRIRIPR